MADQTKWVIIEQNNKFSLYRDLDRNEFLEELSSIVSVFFVFSVFVLIYLWLLKVFNRTKYIEEVWHLVGEFDSLAEAIERKTILEEAERKERPIVYEL